MIQIGLIQFPGSNCERETIAAVQRAGMNPVLILWNQIHLSFENIDGFIFIGGFSYEDRSRAGIIAALDPIMNKIIQEASKGKPVLGICNGAQILVESGLLPGEGRLALVENKRIRDQKLLGTGFYNAWVNIVTPRNTKLNAFTRYLKEDDIMHLPVAHGEGRFIMPEEVRQELEQEGLIPFKYCDEQGNVSADFPINPNGSLGNIAAVCNKAGNIMAIMPHPERTQAGDAIFASMRDYILEKPSIDIQIPPATKIAAEFFPSFHHSNVEHELIISLSITDNHAMTVEQTLQQLGFTVQINRYTHWEIHAEHQSDYQKILDSEVLFSPRKEKTIKHHSLKTESSYCYLVRAKEDILGQQKAEILQDYYALSAKPLIKHSLLWQINSATPLAQEEIDELLSTNILGNRYAHEYFCYP